MSRDHDNVEMPEWRRFEEVVGSIERILGDGGSVESSVWIRHPKTGHRRQIDVLITLKEGRREIRIAFECRRRRHHSDVRWIEELIGKRLNLGIDRMVAVSATPFSAGARGLAESSYIELMELSAFHNQDWQPWLKCEYLTQNLRGYDNLIVELVFDGSKGFTGITTDGGAQVFRDKLDRRFGFDMLWSARGSVAFYETLTPNAPPERRHVILAVTDADPLFVDCNGRWERVLCVEITGDFWLRQELIPLRPALTYKDVIRDQVVLGFTETAFPITASDGTRCYIGIAKVATEDSPPGGGKLVLVQRSAS